MQARRTLLSHEDSATPFIIGVALLVIGILLLISQVFPANQLVILTRDNYSVAHTIMETFAVVVSVLIFFIAFGAQERPSSLRIIVMGCAFLAAAIFDMFHFMSARGMPPFITPNNPNKAITFWLCGRYAVGIGLLVYISLVESRPLKRRWAYATLIITFVLTMLVSYLIIARPDMFPSMFIRGKGLTPAKIISEWVAFGLYTLSAIFLYQRRNKIVNCNVTKLMLALLLMALSELFFTLYTNLNDTALYLGHIYKVIAYFYLYLAIFAETVRQPFTQIKKMLSHDDLTGLASKAAFYTELTHTLEQAKEGASDFCLMLVDLDRFNTVNAILGHEYGDLLLMAVAERIHSILPEAAIMSRFSGDLFSILLQDSDIHKAERLGQHLLKAMEKVFNLGQDRLEIGASIGVVAYPHGGRTASELLRHADVAMHKAKATGRNGMQVFSETLSEQIQRRALLGSCLKSAIEKGELHLCYQPKISLVTERISGWEALLRWQSQELGAVSPSEFISVAEETGLILQIGEWVMREACRQVRAWCDAGFEVGDMGINVSARQFRQNNLPSIIESILHETGVPASKVTLEITETAVMDDPGAAKAILNKLVSVGIGIAVDDFGTGHSSLSYLKTFSLHSLKIDRSFIRDIPADDNGRTIVRSIVGLGHSLGLKVVAEGVETREQLEFLRGESCDVVQGFYFSKPLPPQACLELLRFGIPLRKFQKDNRAGDNLGSRRTG